jgi:hypothetical protein
MRRLFRPDRDRRCDGGGGFLHDPFVFAARNHREAGGSDVTPRGAESLGVSFHVPVFLVPDCSTGSRVILPSGVKIIVNLVPEGLAAVKGWPLKNVVRISAGAMGSAAERP